MHKLAKHLKLLFKHACVMHRARAIASFEKLGRTKFLKILRRFRGMLPWKNFEI